MNVLKLKINLLSIIIISLLVICNLLVINVEADFKHYPDEGLYFDDFSNENSLTKNSCVYNTDRDYFYLEQGSPFYTYNYGTTPNNIGVWETNWSFLSKDNLFGALNQFIKPDSFLGENEITNYVKSQKLTAIDNNQSSEGASIHDRIEVKEEGLDKYLTYDWYRRSSLIDHILDPSKQVC